MKISNSSLANTAEDAQVSPPEPRPQSSPRKPWLIVSLGNPGKKFNGTRHNVGFMMVDAIAEAEGISINTVNFKAQIGKGIKFFVVCEPGTQHIEALLKVVYELYTDYVLKNPFYEMEMPIRFKLFDINLTQAVQKDCVALLGR
ncbi:hypothetical protein ES332_1Z020100v1 [Gossypium tomentosum]|uniref:Trafficking protein particle complex subunit n=1 Tax=Gossypium tomentosum TaxID=34277 RepID=A0A5C7J0Q3_GOSTO|nr:hypothetical protein ES332_1Z020100v1 [Gossypium tomentosum]